MLLKGQSAGLVTVDMRGQTRATRDHGKSLNGEASSCAACRLQSQLDQLTNLGRGLFRFTNDAQAVFDGRYVLKMIHVVCKDAEFAEYARY